MRLSSTFFLFLSFLLFTRSQQQQPLESSWPRESELESYTFPWPIEKVAIIGAGPSGLVAYRELSQAGFNVRLFERDTLPGGNWHYTDETPVRAPIPNADISVADFVPSLPPQGAKLPYEEHYQGKDSAGLLREHRAPRPVWESLYTNAPPWLQQFRERPWPVDQPWLLSRDSLAKYIRSYASFYGINSNDAENSRISYNTRVELVEKRFTPAEDGFVRSGWTLTLKQVIRTGINTSKAVWTKEDFDAVVVATGRFNAPYIPNILGLKAWGDRFPDQIIHSREYRRPQSFTNKTVLVVGAAASGVEISLDLAPAAKKVYLSSRDVKSGNPLTARWIKRLPQNVTVTSEIKRFLPPTSHITTSAVELTNGTILTGIESIVFATGFRYTFPFLPQFHNTSRTKGPKPHPIVTDGTHLRNLYLDIFSIEEPTLGFMCMNIEIQNFKYAEYIAVALSKVWGTKATIPPIPRLWELNEQRVLSKGGYGRYYQFLGFQGQAAMIRLFTGWLNDAASKYGGRQVDIDPPSDFEIVVIWFLAYYGVDIHELWGTSTSSTVTLSGGLNTLAQQNPMMLRQSMKTLFLSSVERAVIEKKLDELLLGYDW